MLKTFQFCFLFRSYINCNKNHLNTNFISCLFYHKHLNNKYVHVNKNKSANMLGNSSRGFEKMIREWEDTELGRNYRADYKQFPGCPFIMMSYNILAQTYLEYHRDLYRNMHPEFLRWECRLDNLLKELRRNRPHILCMQEVEEVHFAAIKEGLSSLDYKSVFYKRTGDKSDGCAIFFSKQLFHIRSKHNLKLYIDQEPLLGRDNIAILLKLSLKSDPNKTFVVANTHLLYNPKRDDVRLAQLQRILTTLKDFAKAGSSKPSPIILVGDFNFPPSSVLFEFLTKSEILWDGSVTNMCREELRASSKLNTDDPKSTDIAHQFRKSAPSNKSHTIKHSLNLESVLSRDQLRNRATTHHREWITVDYIFYTTESNLKLLSTFLPPHISNCFPIPNGVLGSDHHFVAANFLLT